MSDAVSEKAVFEELEAWLSEAGGARWVTIESGQHEMIVKLGNITIDLSTTMAQPPPIFRARAVRMDTTVYSWDRDRKGDFGPVEPINVVSDFYSSIVVQVAAALARAKNLGL